MAGCQRILCRHLMGLLGLLPAVLVEVTAAAPRSLPRQPPWGLGSSRVPVKPGHVALVGERPDGHKLELHTVALDPPIFVVPGMLTEAEADDLRAVAARGGPWKGSEAGDYFWAEEEKMLLEEGGASARDFLTRFDRNRDIRLDTNELVTLFRFQHLPNFGLASLRAWLGGAPAGDGGSEGAAGKDEDSIPIHVLAGAKLNRYVAHVLRTEPWRGERYSNQTWLHRGTAGLGALYERAQAVAGLSDKEMANAEDLQVVRYGEKGHYACHYDSSPDRIDAGDVRFATLGVFLSAPGRGGATVFPGADRGASWRIPDYERLTSQCQFTSNCTELGGVTVAAKKGDAVFWYNARPEVWAVETTGSRNAGVDGIDAMLWSSLHCAAEVFEGEKWFANLWFHAPAMEQRGRGKGEL